MKERDIERILYSEKQAAAALGISVRLLRRWRMLGKGPRYIKLSGRIGSNFPNPAGSQRKGQPKAVFRGLG